MNRIPIAKVREASSSRYNRWSAVFLMLLASLPICMDLTILHVAVPSLTLALHATGNQILWIIDIYPLITAGLLVSMGTLADRVGAKRLFLTGLALFWFTSLAAAYAPNAPLLIFARASMAVGASMVLPATLSIIRQLFDGWKERALALGLWSTLGSVSAAAGPLLGGFLIEHFWWGAVFWINLPIILALLPFLWRILPRLRTSTKGKWPIGQAGLLIAGLIASIYAVKSLLRADTTYLLNLAIFGFGVALLFCFVQKQRRSAQPMLDLQLFSIPAVSVGTIIALVVAGAMAGVELTLAQELQFILGYSPLEAGKFMLPMMTAAAVAGPFAGYLVHYAGLRSVCCLTLLSASFALAGLGMTDFQESRLIAAAFLALLGFSLGVGLTASSIAIISSAPKEKGGAAGGIESFGYDLGTGLGITLFGVLLTFNYKTTLSLPDNLQALVSPSAINSLGDTMVAAEMLGERYGAALLEAGRLAFTSAHSTVLLTASAMVFVLSVAIFWVLRNRSSGESTP